MRKILALVAAFGMACAKEAPKKEQPACEKVTEASCATMVAKKAGPNGFAVSGILGFMTTDTHVTTPEGLNIHAKNTYKRTGIGLSYFNTWSNNVFWGAGLDLLTNLGNKTINAMATSDKVHAGQVAFPITYKQKRPFTASLNFKLGYAYGNFSPFAMIGLRQSYVVHNSVAFGKKDTQRDINFAIQPGLGFMYKVGSFGIGAEYGYHMESTFGFEDKAGENGKVKKKGCHSVSIRLSYFL